MGCGEGTIHTHNSNEDFHAHLLRQGYQEISRLFYNAAVPEVDLLANERGQLEATLKFFDETLKPSEIILIPKDLVSNSTAANYDSKYAVYIPSPKKTITTIPEDVAQII